MIRRILPLVVLVAFPLAGQEPLQPYDARGWYRTTTVELQLTGAFGGGRDVVLSWGFQGVGGRGGRWMQRTELGAGIHAGQRLADRLYLGPQVSLAYAVPGWYTQLDGGTRGEPYLVLGAGAYGVADFGGDDDAIGLSPSAAIGVGMRLFEDEWDVALSQVEVVLQRRYGAADQAPQLYVRFIRAVPRRPAARPAPPNGPPGLPLTGRGR